MTTKAPRKWVLTGIFLAALWLIYLLLMLTRTAVPGWLIVTVGMLAPLIAAGITGALWRGRRGKIPGWPNRRRISLRLTIATVVTVTLVLLTALLAMLMAYAHETMSESVQILFELVTMQMFSSVLSLVFFVILQFVIIAIEIEIGLLLGMWISDRFRHPRPSDS